MFHALNPKECFLLTLVIIFTVPWLVWRVFKTDRWAPLVVVQIVTGIILGPGLLGAMAPEWHAHVFSAEVIKGINGIAGWAVMLFVFLAGIELDLKAAWTDRRNTLVTAGLALAMPMLASTAAAALALWWLPALQGPKAQAWQTLVGIGMACAVTALPILVLFMQKLGILREALGQRILRYASLDDIAIWAVLALILLDTVRLGRQALFLVVFILLSMALHRLMPRLAPRDRWGVALIWLALCALGGEWSGLHFMVGAFMAGVVIDHEWIGHDVLDQARDWVLMLFMPVFFLSTGLRTDFNSGGATVLGVAALLLVASVGGKLLGAHLAGRWLGWAKGEASIIGWLLQTKALIMIIFASIMLDKQLISADAFTALLLMAVASTMLTIPIVGKRLAALGYKAQVV
ncbi:cation:proton antiporter [Silanimonas sp.]|uniref:cation:proton antiporter n=1 Tax=Silanimonas sp. TaxID=1929290 RepID=UPI0022C41FA6|nr:cation:proton antiporter [Silanimonas sp.]MCZ8165680.1 cation:proton antiporter [Silanimonas sp.]